MKVMFKFISLIFLLCASTAGLATTQQTLLSYINEPESFEKPPIQLIDKKFNASHHVTVSTYSFISQTWPKPHLSVHSAQWQHTLSIYRPDTIRTQQALLFINGGTRITLPAKSNPPAMPLDFARIAAETHSVVIDLQDIPNQYLTLDDNIPRKEDSLVAYSWNKYLDNPSLNGYWLVHLAMTKAVVRAMDASQEILAADNIIITNFTVAGASKRGWATWLTALADQRVNAIVPIVIDILNMKENLKQISENYNGHWPPAFYDYVIQKIPERINTPAFDSLIQIEDPLAYLKYENADYYQHRLSIPKYIISASGDDFFVPDSLGLYYQQLPGETHLRVVPNQPHYINAQIVENAILSFYKTIINQSKRPNLILELDNKGIIKSLETDSVPESVRLWQAVNHKNRDFRLAAGIIYSSSLIKGKCSDNHCRYAVELSAPADGWQASFVEVTFPKNALILTSPTYIQHK